MTANEAREISKSGVPAPPTPLEMAWIYAAIKDMAHNGGRALAFNKYSVSPEYRLRDEIVKELRDNGFTVDTIEMQIIVRW